MVNFAAGNTITIPSTAADIVEQTGSSAGVIPGISKKYSYDSTEKSITLTSAAVGTSGSLSSTEYPASVVKISAESINNSGVVNITLNGDAGQSVTLGSKGGTISTNSKDDTIVAGSGAVTIVGGGGSDQVTLGSGGGYVDLSTSNAATTIDGSAATGNNVSLVAMGGSGDDVIKTGSNSKTTVNAGAGNNTIIGGSGDLVLTTGAGNDYISVSGAATINAGDASGSNTIISGDKAVLINSGLTANGKTDNITIGAGGGTVNANTNGTHNIDASNATGSVIIVGATGSNGDNITLGSGGGAVTLGSGGGQDLIIYNGGKVTVAGTFDSTDKIKVGSKLGSTDILSTTTVSGGSISVTFGEAGSTSSSDTIIIPSGAAITKRTTDNTYDEISSNFTYAADKSGNKTITLIPGYSATNGGTLVFTSGTNGTTTTGAMSANIIDATKVTSTSGRKVATTVKAGITNNITLTSGSNEIVQISTNTKTITINGFDSTNDRLQLANSYSIFKTEASGNDLKVTLQKNATDTSSAQVITFAEGYKTGSSPISKITVLNSSGENILKDESDHNGISGDYTYTASTTSTASTIVLAPGVTGTVESTSYPSTVKNIDASKVNSAIVLKGNDLDNVITVGQSGGTIIGGDGKDTFNIPNAGASIVLKDYTSSDKRYCCKDAGRC